MGSLTDMDYLMEQQSMGQQKQPLTWNTEVSEQRIATHRIQPGKAHPCPLQPFYAESTEAFSRSKALSRLFHISVNTLFVIALVRLRSLPCSCALPRQVHLPGPHPLIHTTFIYHAHSVSTSQQSPLILCAVSINPSLIGRFSANLKGNHVIQKGHAATGSK